MTFLYILCNVIFVIGIILFIKNKVYLERYWKIPENERREDTVLLMWIVGRVFIFVPTVVAIIWSIMGVDDKFFPLIRLAKWLGRAFYEFILTVKDDPVRIVGVLFTVAILVIIILAIGVIKEEQQKKKWRQEEEERKRYW